jgi:hypothetical protein
MSDIFDRRRLMQLSLAAIPTLVTLSKPISAVAEKAPKPALRGAGPEHDFDFFLGTWHVKHRRLKQRLANNNEWEEYDGSTHCQSILGGFANMNDSIAHRSSGTYSGLGLRAFDAKTNSWADWYLDGRDPTKIDTPGVGRFHNGVGTFLSDDTFEGMPITVRGIFSSLTADSMQWEQAFSPDGGKTWETNMVLRYTRTA